MESTDLHEPWLVACWPGMGMVGLAAGSYLASDLRARALGELDTSHLALEQLPVKDGLFQSARRPRCWLFAWKAPPGGRDLLILLGEAQPPGGQGWTLARLAARRAKELGVTRVITLAAMAAPIHPGHEPQVFGAATDPTLLAELGKADVVKLEEGEVSGLNGVLVGAAAELSIPGACLLGEFPFFAGALPNPRASAAVLGAFSRLSGVPVDLAGLLEQVEESDRQLRALQAAARRTVEQNHAEEVAANGEPGNGEERDRRNREHVETLFRAVGGDRSRALELKAELDRLGWFREYEDRFLDLFKQAE